MTDPSASLESSTTLFICEHPMHIDAARARVRCVFPFGTVLNRSLPYIANIDANAEKLF
jgi:hypothetical protein